LELEKLAIPNLISLPTEISFRRYRFTVKIYRIKLQVFLLLSRWYEFSSIVIGILIFRYCDNRTLKFCYSFIGKKKACPCLSVVYCCLRTYSVCEEVAATNWEYLLCILKSWKGSGGLVVKVSASQTRDHPFEL
jgi:hypothetical protein